jgi:predicted amidohydrolase
MSSTTPGLLLVQPVIEADVHAAVRSLTALIAPVRPASVALPASCLGVGALEREHGLGVLAEVARGIGALLAGSFRTPEGEAPFIIAADGRQLARGEGARPPVVETAIGRLAVLTEEYLGIPEAARVAALAGAEVVIAPVRTSRSRRDREAVRAAAIARAAENAVALALVDGAGYGAGVGPRDGLGGATAWIAPGGRKIDETGGPGEALLSVELDLVALRRLRRSTANPLLQLRPPLYAPSYHRLATPEAPPPADAPPPFAVCCLQANIAVINDPADKDAVLRQNLARTADLVLEAVAGGAKVVVFPEFWLQGFAWGRSIEEWRQVCITIPGPETAALGAIAAASGVYLAGAAFEVDPDWPGRWFTTAFLLSPAGEIALRARKLHSSNVLGQLPDCSPGDVLSAYGADGLFPVAETPYGRLAVTVSSDLAWPEVARGFRIAGAEIILHAGGSPHTPLGPIADDLRRARARENGVIIASANYGRLIGSSHPEDMSRGFSQIIDWTGEELGRVDGQGEAYIRATVDLGALRRARAARPLALAGYASLWDGRVICPTDRWLDRPLTDPVEATRVLPEVITRLTDAGVV